MFSVHSLSFTWDREWILYFCVKQVSIRFIIICVAELCIGTERATFCWNAKAMNLTIFTCDFNNFNCLISAYPSLPFYENNPFTVQIQFLSFQSFTHTIFPLYWSTMYNYGKKCNFLAFFFLHRHSQFRFSNSFKGRFPFKYTIRNGFYSNGFYLKTFDLYLQLWRFYGKIKWNKIEWQKNNQGKINKETQPVH